MRRTISTGFAAVALLMCASFAFAQTAPATPHDTSKGKALADGAGMTLYVYDRDTAGKSTCTGACASLWPPLEAMGDSKASGDWTIVTRDDSKKQWAYKGKPLYKWSKDSKPGDATGDGLNNVWHIAAP